MKRTEKLQVHLDDEELQAIDDWRFEHHMPSRSAAVRALLHVALKGRHGFAAKPVGTISSREVGVVESTPELEAALGTARRRKVLLVEDEYLVAAGLASIMEDLGYEIIGPAGDAERALALVEEAAPDLAVLDVGLGSETSFRLAETLRDRRIPLIFCTGVSPELPDALKSTPVVVKPFVKKGISAALEKLGMMPCPNGAPGIDGQGG